jgi:type VI protein secretion system component Hcp
MKYAGRISLAFLLCVCIAAVQQTGYVAHASPGLSPHGGAFALYLQVPGVTGGVTAPGFTGWISLLSYSLGSTKAPGPKKPIGTMQITKYVDSTSPWFFFNHGSGKHILIMKLAVAGGKPANVYLQFTFKNTLISSYSISGGGDRPTETIAFVYEALTLCYGSRETRGSGCVKPSPSPSPTPTQTPPPTPTPSPTPTTTPSATPMPSPSPSCTPNPAGACPSPTPSPVGG